MNLALVATSISENDIAKLLLLALVAIALLGLGRWSSHLGGSNPEDSSTRAAMPADDESFRENGKVESRVWGPGADEIAASFHADPLLGKIRMTKFYFEKVDAIPGPIDRNIFADELHVQLYDPDSGNFWWQAFFVATPQGLAQTLRDKSWKYLYAAEILVLPQYDLEEIRRAVVTRVVTDNEFFKGKQEPQEESL
ncbi:MAG TPA: hypothetical protein VFL34_09085 [Candidatus Sulfotelmatobacter sp.]|nr:hypothetical protein [Candidatus Sulfotelmatobacter sp.]